MAQYEPQLSVDGLLALEKVRKNSVRILLGKIKISVARKEEEMQRKEICEGRRSSSEGDP